MAGAGGGNGATINHTINHSPNQMSLIVTIGAVSKFGTVVVAEETHVLTQHGALHNDFPCTQWVKVGN